MKIKNYFFTFLLFTSSVVYSQTGTIIVDSIISGGVQRLFRLYIPTTYNWTTPVPLVFNLHGYTSNAAQQEAYGDFKKIADTANFIIAHAQGLPTSGTNLGWTNFFPVSTPNKDIQFLSDLIDTLKSNYNINLNRIYSTGMSNGGFMSYDLACFLSNRFAAIASVTGSMSALHFVACNPQHPMPVMEIHGTNDATVKYDGTVGNLGGTSTPVDTIIKYWVNFNHCDTTPIFTPVPNTNTTDNCTAEHYVYLGGDEGSTVELYKIIGGDHSWPGAVFNLNTTNMDFSASKEIWRFFSQHALTTAINEQQTKEITFSIYPNPGNGLFTVNILNSNNSKISIRVVDLLGKEVFGVSDNTTTPSYSKQIDLDNISSGIYFVKLNIGNSVQVNKLIIQ